MKSGWINEINSHAPFSNKPAESSITRFPPCASWFAISRAASRRRSCKKPWLDRTASPISSADRASPWARTIIDYKGEGSVRNGTLEGVIKLWATKVTKLKAMKLTCFSWMAWSTRNAALRAVCCAICAAKLGWFSASACSLPVLLRLHG